MFESAINAVYWFRMSTASCEDYATVSLTNTSLLLHLQIRSCTVDGSPADRVSLAIITCPLESVESVIDTKALVAPKSSSVPSFSRSSLASSLRAALPLPIFAPRLTRRPSLTPCKSLVWSSEVSPGICGSGRTLPYVIQVDVPTNIWEVLQQGLDACSGGQMPGLGKFSFKRTI